jgi:hypothetical protein
MKSAPKEITFIMLYPCPVCQETLARSAIACTRCGHRFDDYGSFGGFLDAKEERERQEALAARMWQQEQSRKWVLRVLALVVIIIILGGGLVLLQQGLLSRLGLPSLGGPTQSAEAVIQQYYDDVNSQNYQAAYSLWDPQTMSLSEFSDAYKNTEHDDLTIGEVVSQADSTQRVSVTVVATEKTPSGGTRQRRYEGYYIVGQRDSAWKLLDGMLNPTS